MENVAEACRTRPRLSLLNYREIGHAITLLYPVNSHTSSISPKEKATAHSRATCLASTIRAIGQPPLAHMQVPEDTLVTNLATAIEVTLPNYSHVNTPMPMTPTRAMQEEWGRNTFVERNTWARLVLLHELLEHVLGLGLSPSPYGNGAQHVCCVGPSGVQAIVPCFGLQPPSPSTLVFCMPSTSLSDLDSFFRRVCMFPGHRFVLVGIESLATQKHKEHVFFWQSKLNADDKPAGDVYYVYMHQMIQAGFPWLVQFAPSKVTTMGEIVRNRSPKFHYVHGPPGKDFV